MIKNKASYHLPGLFEFYEFYKEFLPLYREHREYFYEWCQIGSIYGAPEDCLWGGGRVGFGSNNAREVLELMEEYEIAARLTFSNSLIREEHLSDRKCNRLLSHFHAPHNGIIIYSDLLMDYIHQNYPDYYFISTTTKVLTDWEGLMEELNREEFKYVVPDFRLNKELDRFKELTQCQKDKLELLCNECCYFGCKDRKACYENVSQKALGEDVKDHICKSPGGQEGYVFSKAMENPAFIGIEDICRSYLPMGIRNFKIEGRSLGSALILEFLLYYMIKPEYQLKVREKIYLSADLDLF